MSYFIRLISYVCLALLLLVVSSPKAFAQITATANLNGIVKDTSGAVVPGAKVTITSTQTGATRTAISDAIGSYSFVLLPPDTYALQIVESGFKTATVNGLNLYVGQTITQNVVLSPGAVQQTVEVNSTALLLQPTSTDVGTVVTPTTVESLPLNGRDFGELATVMAPGAESVPPYDPTKERYATFAVNGSSGRNVVAEVNGVEDKDNSVGGMDMQLPLSAVEEFSISTDRFSASNGRSEGGVINVITKSGSDKLHGGLYTFYTNTSLNANNYFSEQSNQPTPEFDRQQFGGDVGGPIRKGKDFFFGSLERTREQTELPVPSSDYQELVDAEPLGAVPVTTIPTPFYEWRYNGRLDHHFIVDGVGNTGSLVYTAQTNNDLNDQSSGLNDETASNFTTNKLILSSFNLASVLSSHVVNSFTAGYQTWENLIGNSLPFTPYVVNFPSGAFFGTNEAVPQGLTETKWQFKDEVSVVDGHHTFQMGVNYIWEPYMGGFFETGPVPDYTFLADAQTILSEPSVYPQGFATPGLVGTFSESSPGNSYYTTDGGQKSFGAFIQDDWEESPKLTFDLGIRWDKDFNFYEQTNMAASRTYLELQAINSPYGGIPSNDSRGWEPRVGFSYKVDSKGKSVIRGGFGLYFGDTFQNIPLFMAQESNATIFYTAYSLTSTGPSDTTAPDMPGTNIPLSQWQFGVSPFPPAAPLTSELSAGATGQTMDPKYRNPYSEQWNIGYAYQPNPISVIEVNFIHELGLHEGGEYNINPTINGVRPLATAFANAGIPVLGAIQDNVSAFRSSYNGLNVSYRRSMSNHFTVTANYVLSRASAYDGNAAAFGNEPIDPLNPFQAWDYGPSTSNETHKGSVSGTINLPAGINLAPIAVMSSALPYNCTQGIDVLGYGSGTGKGNCIVLNADPGDLTATKSYTTTQLLSCMALGACHMLGYNALSGDPYFDLDMRVGKAIRWHDHYNLNLFFQGFDLTNKANFGGQYQGALTSSVFQQPDAFIGKTGVVLPKSFRAEFGFQLTF
jgi:outer membrane receptor protein involved in Fe transport